MTGPNADPTAHEDGRESDQAAKPITRDCSSESAAWLPFDPVAGVAKLTEVLGPQGAIERLRAMLVEAGVVIREFDSALIVRLASVIEQAEMIAGDDTSDATEMALRLICCTIESAVGQLTGGAE